MFEELWFQEPITVLEIIFDDRGGFVPPATVFISLTMVATVTCPTPFSVRPVVVMFALTAPGCTFRHANVEHLHSLYVGDLVLFPELCFALTLPYAWVNSHDIDMILAARLTLLTL